MLHGRLPTPARNRKSSGVKTFLKQNGFDPDQIDDDIWRHLQVQVARMNHRRATRKCRLRKKMRLGLIEWSPELLKDTASSVGVTAVPTPMAPVAPRVPAVSSVSFSHVPVLSNDSKFLTFPF
jgi:hypothetical protein